LIIIYGLDSAFIITEVYSLFEDRAKEISEFLNESYEKALEKIKNGETIAKNSWNSYKPRTERERKEWYKNTTAYLYDLSKCHEINQELKETYDQALRICKNKGGKILDFGGGIGDLVILLTKEGVDVTYLDIKSVTSDFAKWRIKRKGLDIRFIETKGEPCCLKERYDVILCIDIMEHLENPSLYLREFYDHLVDEGYLILKVDRTFTDVYPMHLRKNRLTLLKLDKIMEKIGFEQSNGIVWKKILKA
jgi:ubiquinone/menaquinone biosynthesis C-methylase UbiE